MICLWCSCLLALLLMPLRVSLLLCSLLFALRYICGFLFALFVFCACVVHWLLLGLLVGLLLVLFMSFCCFLFAVGCLRVFVFVY